LLLAGAVGVVAAVVVIVAVAAGRKGTPARSNTILVPGRKAYIYLLSMRAGKAVNLTGRRGFPYDAEAPTWSPHGREIAFSGIACAPCDSAVYLMDARGRWVKRLALGAHPAWSRSGWIAFVRRDSNGVLGIYLIRPNGSGLHPLFRKGVSGEHPAWSPDGSKIAFERLVRDPVHGNPQVLFARADGREVTRITYDPFAIQATPAWSPDGKRLAFSNAGAQGNWEIYLINADGSGERKLAVQKGNQLNPTWSPDGRRIAFAGDAGSREGRSSIYMVGTDGRGLTRLTDALAEDTAPAWSPDGTAITFSRRPLLRIPRGE
jgi:Tol biopolymer transport system component